MKFFLAYLCTAIFVVFSGPAFSADGTGVAMVESIDFLGQRNGGEVIHFKLNRNLDPKVFELLGKNPRLVFDFIETGYSSKGRRVIRAGGRFVKKIRVGTHHEPVAKTRVVIDLTSDKEFEFDKEFISSEKILEVRIFLKTAAPENIPAVAEQKSEKGKKFRDQVVANNSDKNTISPTSAKVVGAGNKVESETATPGEQVETIAVEKDVAEPGQASEMAGEPTVKSQIADSETGDIATAREIPLLLDVSYENTTNNKEMVLFKLSGFHPPVVFAIEEEEPRIVCDFLDVQLGRDTQQVLDSKGEYIRRVRVAKHSNPDKVRVVLDLVANNNYDLKQVFFKEDNLFVVIISTL